MNPLWSRIHILVSLMHHDPSGFGSLILIQITPKERNLSSASTLVLVMAIFRGSAIVIKDWHFYTSNRGNSVEIIMKGKGKVRSSSL